MPVATSLVSGQLDIWCCKVKVILMSYTPVQWETGDVVTAEKLNKMDEQISNSANALLIEFDEYNSSTTTYDEIVEAVNNGRKLYAVVATEFGNQYSEVDETVLSNGLFVGRCCFTTPDFDSLPLVTPRSYTVCVITSMQEFTVISGASINFNDLNQLSNPLSVAVSEGVSVAEYVTDKTYGEVVEAMLSNRAVFFIKHDNNTTFCTKPIGYSETVNTYRILMPNGDFYETDDVNSVMQYHPW